jgi:Ca2+-binding EF-hand superfamily protein
MKKVITSVAFISLTAMAVSTSWACGPMQGGAHEGPFLAMDANHDGVVTKKEFDAFHTKHFKALDSNRDGKLSNDELPACDGEHPHPARASGDMLISKRFDTSDTNHDGGLSREEAKSTQMILQHFDELDTDKNGLVTLVEIRAMMAGHRAAARPAEQITPPVAASSPAAVTP